MKNATHGLKCVCVCFTLPGLPGSRDVGYAGKWIVLLDPGATVSLLVLRMNVGDGGQAYQRVAPQTTGCHARTRRPLLLKLFLLIQKELG